jgi:PAS domain S-box-containing protein
MSIAWGPGGTFIYNDAYAPFLGARHPGAMGNAFKDVWSDIWADIAPLVDRVFTGETISFTDMPLVMTRNGYPEDTWWSFSYSPLRDETGAVAGLLNVTSDATPRVLAERRLAAERERQRLALQQMPGFVALQSGPEHRYEYVNDAFVEIAGARNFLGRTLREVFPELAGQGFYELIDRVYATGESFASRAMPIKLDRADGERFIDLIYEPIRDDDKKVTGIFVGGYDVTERCRAEARVRGVLDGMDEGFVLLDPDFRILEINAEGLRLEKRPKSEIVGKVHWSVRSSAEDSDLSRRLKRSMAERSPGDFENR